MIFTSYPTPDGTNDLPSGENGLLLKPWQWDASPTRRVIVALHGHTVTGDTTACLQYKPAAPGTFAPGYHAWALATYGGYAILSIDAGGGTPWGNATAVSRVADAYTYAQNTLNSTSTKIGIMGWSMGGLLSLNYLARYASNVAGMWLWEPALDLRWNAAAAGYTPSYAQTYAGSSYNSNTGGTCTPGAGWASEVATDYPSGYTAYDPMQNTSSYRGLGVPVKMTNASDDNVIPPGAQAAFVSTVNDSSISLRSPQPIGGHTGVFREVPTAEVVSFYQGLSW